MPVSLLIASFSNHQAEFPDISQTSLVFQVTGKVILSIPATSQLQQMGVQEPMANQAASSFLLT